MSPPADDFRPLPLLRGPHLQTVLSLWLRGRPFRHPATPRYVPLPDGDRLVIFDSVPTGWRPGEPVALLVHGLGGNYQSGFVVRVASQLLDEGVRTVRVNLRGCGPGVALARKSYHAGNSEDVRAAAELILADAPGSPLGLVGCSMGGNIVLKLAGEAAEQPLPGLAAVAALAPPVDIEACAELLATPPNRIYNRHFVRAMVRLARLRQRLIPDLPPLDLPRKLTAREFDERYTAPRGGFRDALDYYRRASSGPLVPRIQVPALLLSARDDPFIAVEPLERLVCPPNVRVWLVRHGGHLGYLGHDGAGGVRWAERRIVEWLRGALGRPARGA